MNHSIQKYVADGIEIIELKNADITARLAVNIGNTLFSLNYREQEILYFPFSLYEYSINKKLAGIPFMHPWANRLAGDFIRVNGQSFNFPETSKKILYRDANDLPLHGLLLKSDKWKTIELHEDENSCFHIAEFIFKDEKLLSVFPFEHRVYIKYQLKGRTLNIETTVVNLDSKPMPVSFGYHPYFLIDAAKRNNYTVIVPAKEMIHVDEKMIPTGISTIKEDKWNFKDDSISLKNISFDHGFQNLKFNENELAVFKINDIEIAFDKNYSFAQVYAPDHAGKPYVCIEPMTAPTNALNTGSCTYIQTGEKYSASFSISL
ncbi:MAG: Aldose 1-epimerase [Bacteroidota bacterium]|nr:Aldose 1-epimerase [Bacteroidota bacterium]